MINRLSEEERTRFLNMFTKELIQKAFPLEIFKLEQIVEEKEKFVPIEEVQASPQKKEVIKEIIQQREKEQPQKLTRAILTHQRPNLLGRPIYFEEPMFLKRLSYLRPTATMKKIDVGTMKVLLNDPKVKEVVFSGPEEKLKVRGIMGEKTTNISLDQNQADTLLQNFAKESKIPLQKGVFRAAVGRLILVADVEKSSATHFSLKKLEIQPAPPIQMHR